MMLPSRRWYLVAAGLGLLAPLAILVPAAAGAYFIANVLWVLLLLIDLWLIGRIDLGHFPVTRDPPPAFSVGRPLPVFYRWRNPSGAALTVRVREEAPAPLTAVNGPERTVLLPPGGSFREEVLYAPVRRGKASAGRMHLRVLGRLGLVWRQGKTVLPWPVVVYPNLRTSALRALPTQAQRRREAGFRSIRRIGEGRIFESLREWVPGEETRSIDWKATARRGKIMARHYEDERRQQVMIVLDAGRLLTAEVDGKARLEAAVAGALDLAASAVDHDDNVGLLVFADEVLHYAAPARGQRALRAVLEILAGVEGRLVEPDYPAAFSYLAARNRKRALTVVFTDVIDRTASDALLAQAGALRPRHLPLLVTLRDPALERLVAGRPGTAGAAFERAAAEELLEARAEALAELRGRGVLLLDVPPDGAARAVVQQYERLKRRAAI